MRWLVCLLLLATPLAGCGGDGDGNDDYVERMEAACDERDLAFNILVQPIPDEFTPDYIDAVVRGSVEIIEAYLTEVRDIGSPGDGLDDVHDRYVALLEERLADFEAAVGDEARSAAVFNQPAPDFADLEAQLRLPTCGTIGNGLEPQPEPEAEDSDSD